MPEKSGMDAALCAPLPVGPTAGVTACPKAAVTEAAAAANVANKRKSRRRTPMATSLSWFRRHLSGNATALRLRPKGTRGVCIWRAPWQGGAFQWVQVPPGKPLQPEATGAAMEETKWLKPSG